MLVTTISELPDASVVVAELEIVAPPVTGPVDRDAGLRVALAFGVHHQRGRGRAGEHRLVVAADDVERAQCRQAVVAAGGGVEGERARACEQRGAQDVVVFFCCRGSGYFDVEFHGRPGAGLARAGGVCERARLHHVAAGAVAREQRRFAADGGLVVAAGGTKALVVGEDCVGGGLHLPMHLAARRAARCRRRR
jgi:hypothetical protein